MVPWELIEVYGFSIISKTTAIPTWHLSRLPVAYKLGWLLMLQIEAPDWYGIISEKSILSSFIECKFFLGREHYYASVLQGIILETSVIITERSPKQLE